jgi:hypothetical protein
MSWLFFGLLLVASANLTEPIHDHSLHLDTKFIHGEAMRVAYLNRTSMLKDMGTYMTGLKKLNEVYDELMAIPEA